MLRVYHSNRLERLCDRLVQVIADPLPNAFAPEWFLVQTQGMARWLSLQLAEKTGVAANSRFFMPAAFVWRLFAEHIPEAGKDSAFDRDTLAWRIMALLPAWLDNPAFAPLRHYLSGEKSERKRWQLAKRIADVFDQYLVYRTDLILAWEKGAEPQDWQALLWRALVAERRGAHRADMLQRFLNVGEGLDRARLPARVCVFAVPAIPPAYLAVLGRLAEVIDVHLFVLNPCVLYWGDIRDERNLARLRRQWARLGKSDASEYFSMGHPLLASWGKQPREFIELLHDYPLEDEELFELPEGESLLAQLQREILLLDAHQGEEKTRLTAPDSSLQVHACHGAMREIEVLHDQLQALFDDHPDLSPRDVVVMAPDIDAYAPSIEAVFGAAGEGRWLPWTIADRSRASTAPVLAAFLTLLDLPGSRFTASEVLSILEVPAVLRRAGLDETDYERVRTWVRDSRIRWGLDGPARAAAGLPDDDDNTWAFGLRRLLLGYGMAAAPTLFRSVLPYPHVEGQQAEALGRLRGFVARLERFAARLRGSYDADTWAALVTELLDAFFDTDDDQAAPLQAVRNAMADLAEQTKRAGFDATIGHDVLRDHLRRALTETEPDQRFIAGPITFCSLVPLRSVPFRVVCLIGMNDQAFPRVQRPLGFDRMAQRPRPGDRSHRDDDRYVFLEALLAARDTLYISYVGKDQRDNNALLPSLLVSELLDHVAQRFTLPDADLRARLVTEHALQPFSRRYFGADARLFSYAGEWLPGARAQAGERGDLPPFCPTPLPEAEGTTVVELAELIEFLRHPARHFLQRRLGIVLDAGDEVLEDNEPFELDGLTAYQLTQSMVADALAGQSVSARRPLLRAEGTLPSAHFGDIAFERFTASLQDYVDHVRPFMGEPLPPLEVDLSIGEFHLRGWLDGLRTTGLVRYRHAKLGAADVLGLWLRHVVRCVLQPEVAAEGRHFAKDVCLVLGSVSAPLEVLGSLLALYRTGQSRPVPFFPRAAWAYAGALAAGKDPMAAARMAWLPNDFGNRYPESRDAYNMTAFRGCEPLDDEFARLASAVFDPVLAVAREEPM